MKIAISGASGFVGTYLSNYFQNKGHEISSLSRKILAKDFESQLTEMLEQSDVVINLAGASINGRWTESYKKELRDSRIITTRTLVDTVNKLTNKPKIFISTSAVGYYSSDGCYDEYNAVQGNSFLSELCSEWESEAKKITPDVRLAITRFGVILAPKGGALEKMMLPAKLGMAPVIGSGNQPFPWIDIQDLARAMDYIIATRNLQDVINFVAPQQITNKDLMKAAAKHYHSLFTIKIPSFTFRALLGESSQFMTEGQCVIPTKLLESGFKYESATIEDFFQKLI